MRTKEREKLSTNNKKHIEEKQNTFLQLRTLTHYRNERIRPYHRNYVLTERRIDSLYVKNHESNRIELWNLEKGNNDHHLDSQEMTKIS